MNRKQIVVIGSCNTDMVVRSERLPLPGETILGGTFLMNPGGKGANQAVAAARLGGKVVFVCKTGSDLFGDQSEALYRAEGIDTTHVLRDAQAPSGVALISVDRAGENCIVVAPGANNLLRPDDIDRARDCVQSAAMLVMQLEIPIPTVEYAAEMACRAGVTVVLNPAPAPHEPLSDDLLRRVDILIPNHTEAAILAGMEVTDWESAERAAVAIRGRGVKTVLITLGALGVLVCDAGGCDRVPAFEVEAVDTTAAGDTFCGALCVGLCEGMDLRRAASFAARASSISVTRMGAQASVPVRSEVDDASY